MSYFGDYKKDDVVEEIKHLFISLKETYPKSTISDLTEIVLGVVNQGIVRGIYEIEKET